MRRTRLLERFKREQVKSLATEIQLEREENFCENVQNNMTGEVTDEDVESSSDEIVRMVSLCQTKLNKCTLVSL